MLSAIDIIFLIFAVITLYFSFLIFNLYMRNGKNIFSQPVFNYFPLISILVPAYNEERNIRATVSNLKKLKYPKKLDIIVIDHGSTDRTPQILKELKGIRVFRKERLQENERKAHAMNYGLKYAKGEIIACVDADSYPSENDLINSIQFFSDGGVGAVTTSVFIKEVKNYLDILQNIEYSMIVWIRKLLESIDGVYVTPGALSLYRRHVLEKIGGFDEKNLTEDIEIAWKILYHGYKVRMSTNTNVKTIAPNKFKEWWKQRLRWNIGGLQTCYKYRSTFFNENYGSLGMFVVPFFAFSFVISMLGFGIFTYLIARSMYDFLNIIVLSQQSGVMPFFELVILPNVFWVFGALILILSLVGVKIGLSTTKNPIKSLKEGFYLLIYISLYITVFPIILIHSFYRIFKSKKEW